MSKIATLKKKAADLEKKSPDKAIAVYVELLDEMEKSGGEMDLALYNRVGDLMAKAGNVAEAVDYYEKAVDKYTEGGFFNNAIALCSKILRSSPGRATVYYKLGKISAQKGFKADAKKNFLEYADRMQKAGKVDEAFRALGEFADLVPDETDTRLMLSDQLLKAGKKDQAIEQLQILHEQLDREGNAAEAEATAQRLRAIDPNIEPRAGGTGGDSGGGGGGGDLVFLDLSDSPQAKSQRMSMAKRMTAHNLKAVDTPPAGQKAAAAKPAASPPKPAAPPPKPAAPPPKPAAPPPAAKAPPKPAPPPPPPPAPEPEPEPAALEIESTSLVSDDAVISGGLEIESTSLAEPASDGGALDLIMPGAEETAPAAAEEIPLIDGGFELGEPAAAEAPAEVPEVALDLSIDMPAAGRPSTLMSAKSVDSLKAAVAAAPEDWGAHRELAEALLEEGDRDGGIRELEIAMLGFERASDMSSAMSVADEIVRIDPSSVKHHQKRVEYAYRANDKGQLVEGYLALADALFRNGQVDKSRSIYQRVLELSPGDVRAEAALSTMPEPAPAPPPDKKAGKTPTPPTSGRPTPVADDAFVNLGDWLREDDGPKDTRMVVAEEEPTGNEEADFADMLKKFKQGVAENVEAEDYQSHYDLGVAFKEMGLVDEAIAEFQKALRGPANRVRTYEAIGQCFIEKEQHAMAATILGRALGEKALGDDELVGVLYLLGRANEAIGKTPEALAFYQRVFVVDIQHQDVADRLNALENAAR